MIFSISVCPAAFGAPNTTATPEFSLPPPAAIETAREFYNAGTQKLRAGKLNDAEALLESSISRQDERVQPPALYNLGQVRFAQGSEELKQSPSAAATAGRDRAAMDASANAIQQAEAALAGSNVQQMVEAYLAGRGVRRDLRAATEAVQRAMETHGKTLLKWRRSLDDFKSAAEMNPADTNAVRNAEIVEQAIARLVDSVRQMQQSAASLAGNQSRLNALLKQLRGRIPAEDLPSGAAGNEGDDESEGEGLSPEALSGLQESATGGGQEMELQISPETAGQLLNSIQPDEKLLPLGSGETGRPPGRSRRTW